MSQLCPGHLLLALVARVALVAQRPFRGSGEALAQRSLICRLRISSCLFNGNATIGTCWIINSLVVAILIACKGLSISSPTISLKHMAARREKSVLLCVDGKERSISFVRIGSILERF